MARPDFSERASRYPYCDLTRGVPRRRWCADRRSPLVRGATVPPPSDLWREPPALSQHPQSSALGETGPPHSPRSQLHDDKDTRDLVSHLGSSGLLRGQMSARHARTLSGRSRGPVTCTWAPRL